jgi:hypothetical protein
LPVKIPELRQRQMVATDTSRNVAACSAVSKSLMRLVRLTVVMARSVADTRSKFTRQDFERCGRTETGSLVEKYLSITLITIAIHKLSTGCEKFLWKTFQALPGSLRMSYAIAHQQT